MKLYRFPFTAMGTPCDIQLYAESRNGVRKVSDIVQKDIERLEALSPPAFCAARGISALCNSTIGMLREDQGKQWLAELGVPHLWVDVAGVVGGPCSEAVVEPKELLVVGEFPLHVVRQGPAFGFPGGKERGVILRDEPVEQRGLGLVALLRRNKVRGTLAPATLAPARKICTMYI